ncbi:NAD-dependent epimerase/dehydratase family protein [Priestia megaterium]|uniref:polysaccharide biosynthesis C-terminal domain-containing protein n=1 Tax=Priestia megaterium TaxID=1404 RepID=UPI002E22C061|nr:NAD-dependent epimerase/dehydratase family protein [Priestia megaterium]MED3882343.1 NAD-dependent epimerase/dehydratase family protein [Priestia megaterium]
MKTVLVTGAYGFMGKNLVATLEELPNVKIIKYGREDTFKDLKIYLSKVDFIYHLAGVNRSENILDFKDGNTSLTEELVKTLKFTGRKIPILFSSSIQAELDNPYGISKKNAEDVLLEYGKENNTNIYIYRLPNVFGKWGKPNYNSVVTTWCYNIANNLPIKISNADKKLNLVYIDDVVDEFIAALNECENRNHDTFCSIKRTFHVTLDELAKMLYSFKESRKTLIMQNFKDDLQKFLYSTYLSYLPENNFGYKLNMIRDKRGWLTEFIKSKEFGQIFISQTKPGITRGNHWHHTKVEKFLVVQGEAVIKFRNIQNEDIIEYKVSDKELEVLDIPTGYTHSITNTGKLDLITLFWANEFFDSERSDTYFKEV